MKVVVATFADEDRARRVLRILRDRYDLGPADAQVAPLGAGPVEGADVLLAGRFRDQRLKEIRELVEEHGGTIVQEVDEQRTRPWNPGGGASSGSDSPAGSAPGPTSRLS
jgi:hypothetical protein